jgi:uncharacterized protein
MLTDLHFYAAAIPAVALYGLAKGGFSGVSLLAVPLMALVMSPVQAAAILLPVLLVQDAVTVYAYRHDWDRKAVLMMLPGALFGIALGTLTAAIVTTGHIRIAVGLLAIGFCLNAWFGRKIVATVALPHHWASATGLSALAGYSSFVIHAGGPPYNLYALPRILSRNTFVGTSGVLFALLNLVKVLPYFGLGQFTPENLTLSAALVPAAILANLAGIWIIRRVSTAMFYKMIYGLTCAVGCKLVYDGLGSVFGL